MRFSASGPISPDEAFRRVADFGRIDEWDPAVASVESDADVPLEPDSRYVMRGRPWTGGFTLIYRLREVDPPGTAVYEGGTERVSTVETISVTGDDGGSTVTISSHMTFLGWTWLISPFVRLGVWLGAHLVTLPALRRHLRSGAS